MRYFLNAMFELFLQGNLFPCLIFPCCDFGLKIACRYKTSSSICQHPIPNGLQYFHLYGKSVLEFCRFFFFPPVIQPGFLPPFNYMRSSWLGRGRRILLDAFMRLATLPPSFSVTLEITKSEIFQMWLVICESLSFSLPLSLSFILLPFFPRQLSAYSMQKNQGCVSMLVKGSGHCSLMLNLSSCFYDEAGYCSGCFICQTQTTATFFVGLLAN